MIDNKILNYPSVPADNNCPKGEPINGDSTCEAYEAGRCTVTKGYCTRENYDNKISRGRLSW
jgi:hypothetical protein